MKRSEICVIILTLVSSASSLRAQSTSSRVQTTAGVHTAPFETTRGTIRVHLPSDAAPGDAISGTISVEPAGASPEDRQANIKAIGDFVLEWQEQRARVSERRYEWLVPISLRAGSGTLMLRDPAGQVLSQTSVPVDPVPAPSRRPSSSADTFDIPAEGEIGKTAVIRGAFSGKLGGHTVTLGAVEADLLASSPRILAFRVPTTAPGLVPLRFTSNGRAIDRSLRALDVRLAASRTQLLRGQRATLTATVLGLSGLTEPVTLTVVNQSPAAVRIDDIDRPVTITPRQVAANGTFSVTRRITGVKPGPFVISATVGKAPSAQFDVPANMARTLADWYASTGVGVTVDANEGVQRSVLAARLRLDEFLRQQQANQGDVQAVFAALLSHYCFDLRDDGLSRRRATLQLGTGAGITLIAFRQGQSRGAEITKREVSRLSFTDFLARLTDRFTARQAVGYLFVRSSFPQAPITLNGEKRGQLTDRRFVTPVGVHQVIVSGSQTCRRTVTVSAFQTEVVQCGA